MSYGVDLTDLTVRSANYVDKILRGAKPADLPVQQPTKYDMTINLTTAKALGLKMPQSILARAAKLIEWARHSSRELRRRLTAIHAVANAREPWASGGLLSDMAANGRFALQAPGIASGRDYPFAELADSCGWANWRSSRRTAAGLSCELAVPAIT